MTRPKSRAAEDYLELTKELLTKMTDEKVESQCLSSTLS